MSEWMNVIAKRELYDDDIIKLKFLSRKSKKAKAERERRLEQMEQTQQAQKKRKQEAQQQEVANVPSMVNLDDKAKEKLNEKLNLPKVPDEAPTLPPPSKETASSPIETTKAKILEQKEKQEEDMRAAKLKEREMRRQEYQEKQKRQENLRIQSEKEKQKKQPQPPQPPQQPPQPPQSLKESQERQKKQKTGKMLFDKVAQLRDSAQKEFQAKNFEESAEMYALAVKNLMEAKQQNLI